MKKGSNAYALCVALICLGLAMVLGRWLTAPDNLFAQDFSDRGSMLLGLGTIFLVFTFVGSFFNLSTDRIMPNVFLAIVITSGSTILYMIAILFSGASMLDRPWNLIFMSMVALLLLLISSTFFLHAARKEDETDGSAPKPQRPANPGQVVKFGKKTSL